LRQGGLPSFRAAPQNLSMRNHIDVETQVSVGGRDRSEPCAGSRVEAVLALDKSLCPPAIGAKRGLEKIPHEKGKKDVNWTQGKELLAK